jgi:hypothetical protein
VTGTALVHRDEAATVTFVGQVIVGRVVSLTVMVCVPVALLPEESVALYVRVMVKRFGQVMLLVTSPVHVTVTLEQVSVALPPAKSCGGTCDGHCTVTFAGGVIVGTDASITVTVKLQVAVRPDPSVAVHVTVFVPLAKVEPDAGVQLVVTPGQLSLAVGA